MAAPSMNGLAERFAADGVGSVFLYVCEAHPGESYPHLTSMEQKFRHAEKLRDELGVSRPILVDSLDGVCHRAYGGMPNMTWIFLRERPVYKADWTQAKSVETALESLVEMLKLRQAGKALAPFKVERLDYRVRDKESFFGGLERSGPKAVEEFREVFGHLYH